MAKSVFEKTLEKNYKEAMRNLQKQIQAMIDKQGIYLRVKDL